MKYTAGFIGAGNMGGALLAAACKTEDTGKIAASDMNVSMLERKAQEFGFRAVTTEEVTTFSRFIFLGVKPQVLPAVLENINPILKGRKDRFVLVTMAAGISAAAVSEEYPVIRIMPNTPALIGKGMILYSVNGFVTDAEEKDFLSLMSQAGVCEKLEEKFIDAGSAVSGCGPAFAYLFVEALADGGVECGLPRDKALELAAQTVSGAAEMVLKSGKHPAELKDNVCSPGGTTIAGVHALEQGAFRNCAMSAVTAAYKRTLELKK